MAESPLLVGDKLHIIARRLFADDVHSHFIGHVVAIAAAAFKIEGHAFVLDSGTNSYVKLSRERSQIFSLSSAGYILTVLPPEIDLDKLTYRVLKGRLSVTDGSGFIMEINEFGQSS